MRQQFWVGEDGRKAVSDPDEPLAALEILCWACWALHGRDRRLALVAMNTRAGANPMLWTLAFRRPGGGAATVLWRGQGDRRRLASVCGAKAGRGGASSGGCRNAPDVPRAWIAGQLAEIAQEGKRTIRRVYR